ncbi:hypothetical protein NDU88_005956 [Pleurodeles waltl]|uniref:Secreted protein n=2 Tax=Pleurodeles waltl TaxID=8319 RepID=A0AAV7RK89_PLEWA|nr:hypothetical protein NDU88_005956 [Pleurodeles waltl]
MPGGALLGSGDGAPSLPTWAVGGGALLASWAGPPWAAAMGLVGSPGAAVPVPPGAAAMGVVGSSWAAGLLPDLSNLLPLPSLVVGLWPFPPFGAVAGDCLWVVSGGDVEGGLLRRPFRLLLLFPGGGLAVPLLLGEDPDMRAGGLQYPCTLVKGAAGLVVAEVLFLPRREGGGGSGSGKKLVVARKSFLGQWRVVGTVGMGVEGEDVVVGESRLLSLGAGAGGIGCREVDGCWVGGWLRLCGVEEGVTDTVGEDTGDV